MSTFKVKLIIIDVRVVVTDFLTCRLGKSAKDLLCHCFELQKYMDFHQNNMNSFNVVEVILCCSILHTLKNSLGHKMGIYPSFTYTAHRVYLFQHFLPRESDISGNMMDINGKGMYGI